MKSNSKRHLQLKINNKIEQYKILHTYLELENTGAAIEFAKKIGISRTTLFQMMDELRDAGIKISYCYLKHSYFYSGNRRLFINGFISLDEC